jgi:chromodomain-helicase-DNA-binding protein 7
MGLGKTLQTAAFIDLLHKKLHARGPFLVIAPLSTIPHWQREFTTWTNLNTIVYHGSASDRKIIREQEFAFQCDRPRNAVGINASYLRKCMPRSKKQGEIAWMAQVVITTPEMLVTDDFVELANVEWEVLVVDEAHRLKNHNSRLATNLRDRRFNFGHTLLLTGTPIQVSHQCNMLESFVLLLTLAFLLTE